MDVPEFEYFPHDREQLLNTIARFDDGIKVEDVVGQENESNSLKQYSNTVLIQVLLEFICHAFVKDENYRERLLIEVCKRLSKHKILNDLLIMDKTDEMRVAMKRTIMMFLKQVCEDVIPNAEIDSTAVDIFENNNLATDSKLYYCKNFVELENIGQGGFGAVFKVKYKFNKLIYAVKKIPFDYNSDANFLKVMREANNIATLNHPNIVRYNSAWIEIANSDSIKSVMSDGFTSEFSEGSKDSSSEDYNGVVIKDKAVSSESSESSSDSERSCNKSSVSVNSDYVVFSETAKIYSEGKWTKEIERFDFGSSENETTKDDSEESDNDDSSSSNFKIHGILYIQMEYCDCDLRYWLDKRAESKGKELPFEMDVTEIFTNILNGVVYIHSKGIIHRDLKPHNIFYSEISNTLKIGDFGLATLSGCTVNSSHHINHDHSSAIGTLPYAAPEQIKCKNYDTKVDIYSLGIILIELMNTCSTAAEFSNVLKEVKDGIISEEMRKFPQLVNLVSILISKNPKKRMPAKEILSLLDPDSKVMLKEKEVAIKEINMKLSELEETIKNMKATIVKQNLEISSQNSEISRLNKIISKLQIQSNQ